MKYMIGSLAAMVITLGAAYLAAGVCLKIWNKKKRSLRIVLALVIWVLLMGGIGAVYLGQYSHAGAAALEAMRGSKNVKVTEMSEGFLLDGPGEDTALVFYPGAKVEAESYAPLLLELAEKGVDVFLVDPPFNLAVMNADAAEDCIEASDYKNVYVGGHSMGGMTAALYAAANPEDVDGLILLAAYSSKEIPESVSVLAVYGTEDGVLEMDQYESGRDNFEGKFTEVIIDDGNHAGFGDYGVQKGDREAKISAEKQQQETAAAILSFINE